MYRSYPLFIISLTAALLSGCADVAIPVETLPAEAGSADRISAPSSTASTEAGFDAVVVEAPVIMAEPMIADSAPAPAAGRGLVRAGVLTAGDIDDTLNLSEFSRYLRSARSETLLPMTNFDSPVLARLTGPDGRGAAGQRVTLRVAGADSPFYDGYSGVDGMVTVFPSALGAGSRSDIEMRVFPAGQAGPVTQALRRGAPRQTVALPEGSIAPDFLDLVFVVDATGSMGDELDWLTRDLNAIVSRAASGVRGLDIRYGLVVYRDQGDEYVVRQYGFTGQAGVMRRQLRAQTANGGGDYPEAAADALAAAMAYDWRRGQGERLVFHIADAPPHDEDARRYLQAAGQAARNNVQIFGLGASGVADEAEFLMRQAAAQTGGRYLFLTDDSGVGNAHAEPRISCYLVTQLSDLMTRVIRSELTGTRIEPAPGDVVREVGSYRNGVCLN